MFSTTISEPPLRAAHLLVLPLRPACLLCCRWVHPAQRANSNSKRKQQLEQGALLTNAACTLVRRPVQALPSEACLAHLPPPPPPRLSSRTSWCPRQACVDSTKSEPNPEPDADLAIWHVCCASVDNCLAKLRAPIRRSCFGLASPDACLGCKDAHRLANFPMSTAHDPLLCAAGFNRRGWQRGSCRSLAAS